MYDDIGLRGANGHADCVGVEAVGYGRARSKAFDVSSFRGGPGHSYDLVSRVDQQGEKRGAEGAGSAGNEYTHEWTCLW